MAEQKEKKTEEKTDGEKTGQVKAPGGNKPLLAGIIAGVVVINVVVAFVLIQLLKPPDPEAETEKLKSDSLKQTSFQQTSVGLVSDPIEAIVNIAGTDGMRFLKVVLVFEYEEQHKNLGEELVRREARLRDMLIKQLSAMTLEELNGPDAQVRIQKDFLRSANNTLPPKAGMVSNVYIREFIIQ